MLPGWYGTGTAIEGWIDGDDERAVPSRLDIVGSMPRTPTGKVDTRMLIAQAMERVSHDGR